MQITIRYQRRGDASPSEVEVAPEDYFDPLGEGENYAEHGDPRHQLTHEYLGILPSELEWTECRRVGAMRDTTLRIEYLQGGRGWMSYTHGRENEPELILVTPRLDEDRETLTRLWRKSPQADWSVGHAYECRYTQGRLAEEIDLLERP